ncbi:hypothetical protein [Streptomyces sp. NPDC001380]|uniref:hypothetical protein n=1 Tax=Streptomyces sp. NPDC001380 TaxID=3364566 RepID=UPI0036B0FF72
MAEQRCTSCSGSGATTQTRYEIVTRPDGTTTSEQRQVTAPCGRCGGRGSVTG